MHLDISDNLLESLKQERCVTRRKRTDLSFSCHNLSNASTAARLACRSRCLQSVTAQFVGEVLQCLDA